MNKKTNREILGLGILTGLVVLFIFSNSLITGTDSGNASLGIVEWLRPLWSLFIDEQKVDIHFLIRKAAHMAEFAGLGFCLGILFWRWEKRFAKADRGLVLFAILAVAVIDEFIQQFVEGRGSMVSDVLIDFAGGIAGLLLAMAVIILCQRRKRS